MSNEWPPWPWMQRFAFFWPEHYTGEDRQAYAKLVVKLRGPCPVCSRWMIAANEPLFRVGYERLILQPHAQLATLNLGVSSATHGEDLDVPYCQDCVATGRVTFVCALCRQERPGNESQESFGDPAEHLCTICYATRSAKEWAEAVERLEQQHRWDFQ